MGVKQSAGILLFRHRLDREVLIGHLGGPLWARKDRAAWSIPKGEVEGTETPWETAVREFGEELGVPVPDGDRFDLGEVRQSGGKRVRVWAIEADLDVTTVKYGTFTMEWPPRSGRRQRFPELDRVEWTAAGSAADRLVTAQRQFLDRLSVAVGR